MGGITRIFDRPMTLRGKMEASGDVAKKRPEHETHLTKRPDRVGRYLKKKMNEITFDEFSPEFLKKAKMEKEFSGIPIPLRDEDREAFKEKGSLNSAILAENMARVIGIDPHFTHAEEYRTYLDMFFGQKAVDNLTRKAKDYGDRKEYIDACIYFRAALVVKHDNLAALYGYARVLRKLYSEGTKENYIGHLKAESLDYFELTTEFYPRFDMGWYYLGYMYLNLGLYIKAKLAWEEYLKVGGRIIKDRQEIKKRIAQLKDPIQIENGYNAVLSGKWANGIKILEPYKESRYNDWWPLWYYLGVAYARKNRNDEAIEAFKNALKGAPRHIESMEELEELYTKTGNKTAAKKYREKLKLVSKE